eukprot:2787321-Prymnesium_polylepis.1
MKSRKYTRGRGSRGVGERARCTWGSGGALEAQEGEKAGNAGVARPLLTARLVRQTRRIRPGCCGSEGG